MPSVPCCKYVVQRCVIGSEIFFCDLVGGVPLHALFFVLNAEVIITHYYVPLVIGKRVVNDVLVIFQIFFAPGNIYKLHGVNEIIGNYCALIRHFQLKLLTLIVIE